MTNAELQEILRQYPGNMKIRPQIFIVDGRAYNRPYCIPNDKNELLFRQELSLKKINKIERSIDLDITVMGLKNENLQTND